MAKLIKLRNSESPNIDRAVTYEVMEDNYGVYIFSVNKLFEDFHLAINKFNDLFTMGSSHSVAESMSEHSPVLQEIIERSYKGQICIGLFEDSHHAVKTLMVTHARKIADDQYNADLTFEGHACNFSVDYDEE